MCKMRLTEEAKVFLTKNIGPNPTSVGILFGGLSRKVM